jgi:hypothetical protein
VQAWLEIEDCAAAREAGRRGGAVLTATFGVPDGERTEHRFAVDTGLVERRIAAVCG